MKLRRYGPVLEPKGDIGAIFNCGATEHNGNIYLLPRVVKKGYTKKKSGPGYDNYISEIWLAESKDGRNFKLSKGPIIKADKDYDIYGCEDPRITKLDDEYLITYTTLLGPAFSGGTRVGLASTKDLSMFEKHGIIGPDVDNKDVVIFPEKINGKITVLHRIKPDIQIQHFDSVEQLKRNYDNTFWEEYMKNLDKHVILRSKYEWEARHIGPGVPPIKTDKGWLLLYHAVDKNLVYRMGAALLDLDNPSKVIARSPTPILEPEMEYERVGDIPNVVFPEGAIVKEGELFVYYGAADKICSLATCNLGELIDSLEIQ